MSIQQAYRGGDSAGRPGWWLRFNYDADLIERLKRAVPHTDRLWSYEAGAWWVAERWEERLAELMPDFSSYQNQLSLF